MGIRGMGFVAIIVLLASACGELPAGIIDYDRAEPAHVRLSADVAASGISVEICRNTLSTQGVLNTEIAIERFSGLPGVDMTFGTPTYNDSCVAEDIWMNGPTADFTILISATRCDTRPTGTALPGPGVPADASGAVCYLDAETNRWSFNPCYSPPVSATAPTLDRTGCDAEQAVLVLSQNDGGTSGSFNNIDGGLEPSVGVITHEMGHMFGMLHPYIGDDACLNGASGTQRDPLYQDQHGATSSSSTTRTGSGANNWFPGDVRSGHISAYTLGFLQDRYGPDAAGETSPPAPEWYLHDVLVSLDESCADGPRRTVRTSHFLVDYPGNAIELCHDAATSTYLRCTEYEGSLQPRYSFQFSSLSEANCTNGAVLELRLGSHVESQTWTPSCEFWLDQGSARFDQPIPDTIATDPSLTETMTLELSIDDATGFGAQEPDRTNNSVTFDVELRPAP